MKKFIEDKIKHLSESTLVDFMENAYSVSEAELEKSYHAVKTIKPEFGTEFSGPLSRSIDDMAYFVSESDSRFLVRWAQRCIRRLESTSVVDEIHEKFGDDLNGVELSNKKGDKHIVITPEAYTTGLFRATYFDANGFYEHSTHDSYKTVLKKMISENYKTLNPGVLNRLASTTQFQNGNANLAKARKNRCKL